MTEDVEGTGSWIPSIRGGVRFDLGVTDLDITGGGGFLANNAPPSTPASAALLLFVKNGYKILGGLVHTFYSSSPRPALLSLPYKLPLALSWRLDLRLTECYNKKNKKIPMGRADSPLSPLSAFSARPSLFSDVLKS